MLVAAIIAITLALVFYSIGVIGEARRRILEWRDVAWFSLGLVFDTTGTILMTLMQNDGVHVLAHWASVLMAFTGTAAILLMAVHVIGALYTMKVKPQWRHGFHKFSLTIYSFWLIAYVLGPIGLMAG